MLRTSLALAVVFLFGIGSAVAADQELTGKFVKADVKNSVLIVKTSDGEKNLDVNDATKFIGPRGGVSAKGIKDDRLVPGVELKLVVAGNNRTLREVHIPERNSDKRR